MARGVALLAIGAVGLALAGCQTDSVSLDEAKKITTTMSGAAFVAPPRTINDITAILDQEKRSNPQGLNRAREIARQSPPAGASHDVLARFYWERGQAAARIGDFKQQIADFREAERLTRDDVG